MGPQRARTRGVCAGIDVDPDGLLAPAILGPRPAHGLDEDRAHRKSYADSRRPTHGDTEPISRFYKLDPGRLVQHPAGGKRKRARRVHVAAADPSVPAPSAVEPRGGPAALVPGLVPASRDEVARLPPDRKRGRSACRSGGRPSDRGGVARGSAASSRGSCDSATRLAGPDHVAGDRALRGRRGIHPCEADSRRGAGAQPSQAPVAAQADEREPAMV